MTTRFQQPERDRRLEETDPLPPETERLWLAKRDPACTRCVLGEAAAEHGRPVCMFGAGSVRSDGMIVGEVVLPEDEAAGQPFSPDSSHVDYLNDVLRGLDVDPLEVYSTYAVKCRAPVGNNRVKYLEKSVKVCGDFLSEELLAVRPRAVLALGAIAYYYFAHKKGITKNRGQAFTWTHPDDETLAIEVVPAMHPNWVLSNPRGHSPFVSDLTKWARLARGEDAAPQVEVLEVHTLEDLRAARAEVLEDPTKLLTFDLETRGFKDHVEGYSRVWCASVTRGRRNADGAVRVWSIPLEHPETDLPAGPGPHLTDIIMSSPAVREAVEVACELLLGAGENVEVRVNGHNVKFDVRNMRGLQRRHGLGVTA